MLVLGGGRTQKLDDTAIKWLRGVVVIIIAHLHSTNPELRFCAGSNPACSVSQIGDGENL